MNKYIDVEKLYKYLEQVGEAYPRYTDNVVDNAVGNVISGIKTFIASLQQEPRFPQYNNIVDKVFGAGNLESFEYREAEMLVALAKEELLKSLQQEQPEMDLDKEIEKYCRDYYNCNYPDQIQNGKCSEVMPHIAEAARYFWNKGYNARKEKQSVVELFQRPETPIKDAVDVTSRLRYIDADLKPIAEFIMDYSSWNLHKDEWNHPVLEVPLFRVLDALVLRGKPYCCGA